ncbi:Uncharacterised protein [Kocuria rosea]|nr:Uncharacterised protein [Kocuria rosea]
MHGDESERAARGAVVDAPGGGVHARVRVDGAVGERLVHGGIGGTSPVTVSPGAPGATGATGAAGAAGGAVDSKVTGSVSGPESFFFAAAATPAAATPAAATPAATALPETPALPSSPREAAACSTPGVPTGAPSLTEPRQAPVA